MSIINSNQEFSALFNNAAIGIVTINKNGEIVLANQFALNQFGYTEAELIGQKIEILIPRRFMTRHVHHRDNYHDSPHSRTMGIGMDLYGKKKDDTEFPVEVSLSPYKTEEGAFTISFISDISVRKEAENALLQLNAELEQKVKERTESLRDALAKEKDLNELKSRFVSMASHEFRTPLSTVLSSAYLTLKYDTTEEQPKRDKHIKRIVSSVNLLTDILNDFLSLGKIEEGKIQIRNSEFDIKEHIENVISEMQSTLKKGQSIVYHHTGPSKIMSDPSLMSHIVMNLFSNAIKFSPAEEPINVATVQEEGELIFSIKDKGLGISKEDQQHLFGRFFRGHNVANIQGTGLGLHIVQKYAELLNGTIECISDIGAGTEFIVKLKNVSI